ncbi:MAG: Flagellar brake protein YcgR [Eubacteriales bacterium]|jgi:hypothetical protein
MFPISTQYLHSPCEIRTISNELITTGSISDILHGAIQICNDFDNLPIIHCNTPVKMNIYNNTAGFKVLVGKVFLSTAELMQITDIQNLVDFEQRSFFRLKVTKKVKARLLPDKAAGETDSKEFDATITDLSLSGLFMNTTQKLEINQRFTVTLCLFGNRIPFNCKVERIKGDPYMNGYGCSFLDNTTHQSDLLCRYLFELQREQIRIARGLL